MLYYFENLKLTAMALSVCHLVHLKGGCCLAQQVVAVIVLQTPCNKKDTQNPPLNTTASIRFFKHTS